MSFSAYTQGVERDGLDMALEELTTSPAELTEDAQALFETGRTIVKDMAAKLPNSDALLNVSISGHAAPDTTGYSSLTVGVSEAAPVMASTGG